MKITPQKIRPIAYIIGLFLVIYGINFANVNNSLIKDDECILDQNRCIFMLKDSQFGINFVQSPVVEEELLIDFDVPNDYSIHTAYIEGVNMFMGKTPVMFEQTDDPFMGVTFLGSCNLAQMKWALQVTLVSTQGEQQHFTIHFLTHQ